MCARKQSGLEVSVAINALAASIQRAAAAQSKPKKRKIANENQRQWA